MRVFVMGGTGVIGRRLVPLLVSAGYDVTVSSRSGESFAELSTLGVKGVVMDALEADSVSAALLAASPEVVIHQATDLSKRDSQANARLRRDGTRHLVDAAKKVGARKIVAQSISWAYEPGSTPAEEATPLDDDAEPSRAVSVRGVRALESAVSEIAEHVVLRYGTLYGPGTWFAPGGPIAGALAQGMLPANDAVSSFLHVEDAAAAAVQALEWDSGTYNIVDDVPAPASAWVPVAAKALGAPVPSPTDGGGGTWERGARNAKARSAGWVPVYPSWSSGFRTAMA
ncbi:NAD(P)-dependent oxidoreductase [Streptomyces sp. NE06-03E]|uniref:NAD-dependent epimerase/dehydratase family protein n=1 Tax=unclassified Streptomyces TaxID=2593676 RepID=UPI0029B31C39|nr:MULTISPECIES: NAD(P)-dependent oxidoreductase [unclassified Streptomyces]MDX3054281.1 NAD(P)-dependent oxidoreductase [Streptomyces sp. NE06-03E]